MISTNLNSNKKVVVSFLALGGLDEMGKNCYILQIDDDAFIIEAGCKYPSSDAPGIDCIVCDFSYLKSIQDKVKAIIITHGHDDQYGALPFLLNYISAPIYATLTTVKMIQLKYENKNKKINFADFHIVKPSDTVIIAGHVFEFFQTTHSITESFGFALKTRFGNIVYTSDYISDYSPISGYKFDLPKVARLSEQDKTFLLLTESEAADKIGIASPNHKISDKIKDCFEDANGKIIVSIYNQNFFNIQEIINLAIRYKKKVCIANPSSVKLFEEMIKIHSIEIEDDMLIPLSNLKSVSSKDLVLIISGDGEQLYNYCNDVCDKNTPIVLTSDDIWINCAPTVAGVEAQHIQYCDNIYKTDCKVITLSRKDVSSMHAQQEDLKMMISLFRPKYYIPVKGDYRLLIANAMLAIDLHSGLNHTNTFIVDNGNKVLFDENGNFISSTTTVAAGDVLVDAGSAGNVNEDAVEERNKMSDAGTLIMGLAISSISKTIVSDPDVQMKGFVFMKDNEPFLNQIQQQLISVCKSMLDECKAGKRISTNEMSKRATERVVKFVNRETDKDPLVVTHIIDIDNMENIDE